MSSGAPRSSHPVDRKAWTDVGWGYGAFGVQVTVGLALNFLILGRAGAESLGIFSQLYALFSVGGQLAVLGLHDSVQKHVAERERSPGERDAIGVAALLLALVAGTIGALVLAAIGAVLGAWGDKPAVASGALWLAPGLLLFVVNKVLLGILNGRRRMAAIAVAQALRAGSILAACLVVAFASMPAERFGLAFTLAEIVVLGWALWSRPVELSGWRRARVVAWLRPHASFGLRATPSGFLSEAFVRIDVLMLGLLRPAWEVGIYSFAAFFFEGLYALAMIWRHLSNPILARLIALRDRPALGAFLLRTCAASLLLTGAAAGTLLAVFPYFEIALATELVAAARQPMWILAAAMTLYAAVVPFEHVLLQAGRPGLQSVLMAVGAALNVALNAVLITRFGLMGAAWATALSFTAVGVILSAVSWFVLRWRDAREALPDGVEEAPPAGAT